MQSMVIEKRRVQNAEKQTLEAEEAGVIRSDTFGDETRESDEGIEMQELIARESTAGEDTQGGTNTHVNTHPLDEFYTGNVTLARLNVGETIRRDVMSATTAIEDVQESAASGSVFLPGLFGLRWRTLQT